MAGIAILSAAPFLAVELFTPRLYRVMDISSYLVFHNVAEFFSALVSLSIFGLGWFSFEQNQDRHSLFLSVAFLAIGLMDLMHTLGYAGMPPLVTSNSPNKSTQFWIAVRFFSASAFLVSAFIHPDRAPAWLTKTKLMAAALLLPSLVFIAITFFPFWVPATFIQGVGLTPFKKTAEYVIIGILLLATAAYSRRFSVTGNRLITYYLAAFVLCIFSELVFAVYNSVFDIYNVLGHLYKLIAFALIYKGIFVTAVRKPYEDLMVLNEELRQNRNMLSHVINSIPQAIFWKDCRSVYGGCNQVFARQAGVDTPESIIGKCDFDLPWGRDMSEMHRSHDREVMEQSRARYHMQESRRQGDGTTAWFDTTKIPLTDTFGRVVGVLGVCEDITRRRQAEEELKETLLFNQQIIQCAREGIIVYDSDLRCLVWNRFMEELSGVVACDMIGKLPGELFPFLTKSGLIERLTRCLAGEAVNDTMEYSFEIPLTGKDDWVSDNCAPLSNARGEVIGVIQVVRDVSERRKAEEQLRQSQKMEALGQLAGGVAHDFNNMLQVILGYASMLRKNCGDAHQLEQIAEIEAASRRAAELTSGLLSYSRKQIFNIELTDLNSQIAAVEKFLRRILGEDMECSLHLSTTPLVAAIDRVHMQQVFVNLAANARDAMPQGGRLSICLEELEMDGDFVRVHGFGRVGPFVLITVSDTGSGIPHEHLLRIFEPFFTTKGVGTGTGLGLSIVYGIISQHNGFINCYSEEGMGTTFRIYLPLSVDMPQPSEHVPSENTEDDQAGITVLVAEDEPGVRLVTRSILEQHGYRVIEASNGREAVEIFHKRVEEIDLVLLDALMPKLNGAETLAEIRALKPGTKALFMSGYAREIMGGRMLIPDDIEFIKKPVMPLLLVKTIGRIVRGGVGNTVSAAQTSTGS
jgi:PAS domain S-box-containing protein